MARVRGRVSVSVGARVGARVGASVGARVGVRVRFKWSSIQLQNIESVCYCGTDSNASLCP